MRIETIIGNNLKYFRYQSKLSQEKFYGQFGLNYRYLASVERGKINVSVEFLDNLAKVLQVDIRDFFNKDQTRWIFKKRIDGKEDK